MDYDGLMAMFKPMRWNTLPRDFLVIQVGFSLFGLSIVLMILADLGASPWVMLTVALSHLSGLTPGTITVLVGAVVLIGAVLMREHIGWGTLGNIMFIGPWVDLYLWLVPSITGHIELQIAALVASIIVMGLATAIYIGVNAGAGPRDSLMLAVQRITGWSLRRARTGIDLIVFAVAWLLGGPFGVGTIVLAIMVGPSIQWSFKLLNVQR